VYLDLDDIKGAIAEDVLVYLVDDEKTRTLATAGEARIMQRASEAESEANSYVALKYTLPLAETPLALKTAVLDIAIYRLFMRRGIRPGTADELVADAYKRAVAWLRDVAAGKAILTFSNGGSGSDGATVPSAGAAAQILADERVFSREKLRGF
jgi:phage gp36-like protein